MEVVEHRAIERGGIAGEMADLLVVPAVTRDQERHDHDLRDAPLLQPPHGVLEPVRRYAITHEVTHFDRAARTHALSRALRPEHSTAVPHHAQE